MPAVSLSVFDTSMLAGAMPAYFGSALVVAVKMLLPLDHLRLAAKVPAGATGTGIGTAIGAVSAMMGIGGGTVSVPVMTLLAEPIHRAVGTGALFGLLISVPGTIGYLFARPDAALPGGTVGLVSLVGVALIAPGSMLTAR